ncbi:hypothetical protein MVES_002583 [Malassezia vespertilionis]|uniref:Minichromosome loss protein Mcl1 middle region domain-containing protein n=1 Tax=Malassezia vespertilionis TaxID=2020962 RepID=A0A2N1JAW2_9BASI|nr:hypothetical protein MVES_002583 [Malassezia vespertilionis]
MASLMSDELNVQVTHTSGITKALRLITAGEDHLVRLLPSDAAASDINPVVIEDATRPMTWIDADENYLVTASEDGSVRLYDNQASGAEITPLRIVRREVLPVRCAALEGKGRLGAPRIAVCSDELIVRVVNADDPRSITLLTGHTRGVRAASWSPVWPLLLTSGSDGDVRAWDMSGNEPRSIKVLQNILPALRPESEYTSSAAWHPSGAVIAIPLKTHEIVLVRAPLHAGEAKADGVWETVATLGPATAAASAELKAAHGLVSALAFCPNGRYLAVATEDLQVTIYALDSRRIIRAQQAEAVVTDVTWHPTQDALAWTDMQGQLVRWDAVIGATLPSPVEELHFQGAVRDTESDTESLHHDLDDLFDDTVLDNDQDAPVPARKRNRANADEGLVQPPFQPASTPMIAQRRYLCVSPLGALSAADQDTHQTISFDSYDTSQRRNFRFTDNYGYKMASMAAQGVVFACEQESGSPSSIFYRPFDDVPGIQAEWSVHLPHDENAVAVALGGVPNVGSLADVHEAGSMVVDESYSSAATALVATSRGFLRFFGHSGMQRYVWALGHRVVTLAASAHAALVVYESAPATDRIMLEYLVIELAQLTQMQHGSVPLPSGATLAWAGFNELNVPALYDSQGMVYILDRAWRPGQARWVPALDTRVSLQSNEPSAAPRVHCWPIGITTTQLLGLLLPVAQRYPSTGTRPLVQELALALPFAHRDASATPLEEAALRHALLANATRDARAALGESSLCAGTLAEPAALEMEADKALLQLIQLACKGDRYARALDGTRALHSEATLDAALKIASFFHLPALADRMELVRAPLAVHKQFEEEEVERGTGTDALLRNTVRVQVPAPAPASGSRVQEMPVCDAVPEAPRTSAALRQSALAQEGHAHKRVHDTLPSVPSSAVEESELEPVSSVPTIAPSVPTIAPSAPKTNPFARTHSARNLEKSQSFFDRAEAPKRKANEEESGAEKRSSRQSTLASFAYSPDP